MASGANDDKKRAAMERIKAFNDAQAKKRAASGIPAPTPPLVGDPTVIAPGQIHNEGHLLDIEVISEYRALHFQTKEH